MAEKIEKINEQDEVEIQDEETEQLEPENQETNSEEPAGFDAMRKALEEKDDDEPEPNEDEGKKEEGKGEGEGGEQKAGTETDEEELPDWEKETDPEKLRQIAKTYVKRFSDTRATLQRVNEEKAQREREAQERAEKEAQEQTSAISKEFGKTIDELDDMADKDPASVQDYLMRKVQKMELTKDELSLLNEIAPEKIVDVAAENAERKAERKYNEMKQQDELRAAKETFVKTTTSSILNFARNMGVKVAENEGLARPGKDLQEFIEGPVFKAVDDKIIELWPTPPRTGYTDQHYKIAYYACFEKEITSRTAKEAREQTINTIKEAQKGGSRFDKAPVSEGKRGPDPNAPAESLIPKLGFGAMRQLVDDPNVK